MGEDVWRLLTGGELSQPGLAAGVGRKEGLDTQFFKGDVLSGADGGDGREEANLDAATSELDRD